MSPTDLLAFCWRALSGHRLRTSLSLLGMSIGVGAVVILTALGEGARRYVLDQFASIGSNLIIVVPGRNETTGFYPGVGGVPNDLTLQDAQAVLRNVTEVVRVAPISTATESVAHSERRRQVAIVGTTSDFIEVQEFSIARGSFLPPGELDRGSPVAVLGSKVARELFQGDEAVGQLIRIGDHRARVIGVLAKRGVQLGFDMDEVVVIPVATAMRLFNRSSLFRIICQVHAYADLDVAELHVYELLTERHGEEDITTLSHESVVSTLSAIMQALTLAVAAIAAVSLSVAGLGIMNVMLVSVSERTSEVGLLKALGARRGQIVTVFLTEAALLSTAGGLLGVVVGWSLIRLLVAVYPAIPASPPLWSVLAALTLALLAGILFGVLPARRATNLDPVAALARR